MSGRKKALLIITVLSVLSIVAVALVYVLRSDTPAPGVDIDTSDNAQIQAIIADQKNQAKRLEDLNNSVSSVDDLKALSVEEQSLLGVLPAKTATSNGQVDLANSYIAYLMSKNDNDAIEATKLCYSLASTIEQKNICSSRALELMHSQGILAPGEPLPVDFFDAVEEQG